MKGKCSQSGCSAQVHAKGLCKTHYGRKWRGHPPDGRKRPEYPRNDTAEERRALAEQGLVEARAVYSVAVGLEARTKWRKRIQELEIALQRLEPAEIAAG
jgi:hypothetical protein